MIDIDAIALNVTYQIENAFAVRRGKGGYVQRRAAVQIIIARALCALSPPEPTEAMVGRVNALVPILDDMFAPGSAHPKGCLSLEGGPCQCGALDRYYRYVREVKKFVADWPALRAMPLQDHGLSIEVDADLADRLTRAMSLMQAEQTIRDEVLWLEKTAENYGGHPADTLRERAEKLRAMVAEQETK